MYMIYNHLFFLLFFRDPILKDVRKYTNKGGYYKLKNNRTPIETDERNKFIGTLLLIGLYKSKGNMSRSFGVNLIVTFFNKLFSRNRFQEILRMMHFDDAVARLQSISPDRIQPIQKNDRVMEHFFA